MYHAAAGSRDVGNKYYVCKKVGSNCELYINDCYYKQSAIKHMK